MQDAENCRSQNCCTDSLPQHATKKARPTHKFGFPFPPYPQQHDLMTALYSCLDEGGVGIFESPTGTGKSLSLLCATLAWLHDQEKKDEAQQAVEGDSEPAWVEEQVAAAAIARLRAGRPGILEARRLRALRLSSSSPAPPLGSADAAGSGAAAHSGGRGKPARSGGRGSVPPGSDEVAALAAAAEGAEEALASDAFALPEVNEEGISLEQVGR